MARALPPLGLAVRLVAAAIWLVAGASKLADLQRFQAQVHAYRVLPAALEAPFAYGLPFVEVGLGLYLAFGLLIRPAALLACALMVVFIAAEAQAWARGLSLDCGCFGSLVRDRTSPCRVRPDDGSVIRAQNPCMSEGMSAKR